MNTDYIIIIMIGITILGIWTLQPIEDRKTQECNQLIKDINTICPQYCINQFNESIKDINFSKRVTTKWTKNINAAYFTQATKDSTVWIVKKNTNHNQ